MVIDEYSGEKLSNINIRLIGRRSTGFWSSENVDDCWGNTNSNGESIIEYSSKTERFNVNVNNDIHSDFPDEKADNKYLGTDGQFEAGSYSENIYLFKLKPSCRVDFYLANFDSLNFDSITMEIYHQKSSLTKKSIDNRIGWFFVKVNQTHLYKICQFQNGLIVNEITDTIFSNFGFKKISIIIK